MKVGGYCMYAFQLLFAVIDDFVSKVTDPLDRNVN